MSYRPRVTRHVALTLLSVAALAATPVRHAAAQKTSAAVDKDVAEIRRYVLSMDKFRKYLDLSLSAARMEAEMARSGRKFPEADADDSNDQTLDAMVAKIERIPEARKLYRDAGITPREFAVMSMALFSAMMANGIGEQQKMDVATISAKTQVPVAQLRFVRENGAEIKRLSAEYEKKIKALKPSDEAPEDSTQS